jgi:hypothetical protein
VATLAGRAAQGGVFRMHNRRPEKDSRSVDHGTAKVGTFVWVPEAGDHQERSKLLLRV